MSPMQGYVQGEQEAAAGQEQNELGFYRQKMQEAVQQLQAQQAEAQQTQQHVAELEQQAQASEQQQAQYQQMVSSATQESVAARDEVIREQQASAAMRIAYQQLRGELLNVASKEPPSTEMLAEQAAMTSGPAPGAMPGADPTQTDPAAGGDPAAQGGGAPAPGGEQAPAGAPAAGQDPAMQKAPAAPAAPAAPKPATPKPAAPAAAGAQKTAHPFVDQVKKIAPHALAGAALGAGVETAYAHKGSDPLREKIKHLEAKPGKSFSGSLNLAQAKARLAVADAVDKHPKAALLSGILAGGVEGAISGPRIVGDLRKGMKNVKDLRASK